MEKLGKLGGKEFQAEWDSWSLKWDPEIERFVKYRNADKSH